MPRTLSLLTALAWLALTQVARADATPTLPRIVAQYDAPPECPSADTFAAAVRSELAGRKWDGARPLEVRVVVWANDGGYAATMTSNGDPGGLERTISAPNCSEATDIAAAIVALAQADWRSPDVVVTPLGVTRSNAPPTRPPSSDTPVVPSRPVLAYSFSLGYGAFTAGPADPVLRGSEEVTTFNPAQGVRLGFGVTRSIGWWKPSVHLGVAYYRQSTTTVPAPTTTIVTSNVSIDDRDVLLATVDGCPVEVDYQFLSLMPCATFSMMQSRGQSGNDPGLEVGFGGTARVRAKLSSFFLEGLGTAVAVTSSYEPPSQPVRFFYALSVGMMMR
jgi:hypothetical protein